MSGNRRVQTVVRLDADIVPDEGLGGLRLRAPICKYQDVVGQLAREQYRLFRPFDANYFLADGAIKIGVDVRNGRIYRLSAEQGYEGRLFSKIAVGMLMGQAMALEPRLYYDESPALVLCRGVKGICLDVPPEHHDAPPDVIPNLPIATISVLADEALSTLAGFEGTWGKEG